jgi:aspartate aminotransferase-like enzyme
MNPTLFQQHVYTPGPVRMAPEILQLGALQTPYFRNAAFSELLLECEAWLLAIANAPPDSRVIFLTAAGTAAMEATVMNLLLPERSVGVVNGGTFGQRFVEICQLHKIPVQPLNVDRDPLADGRALAQLRSVDALLLNAHETSVGHLYDLNATGEYCRRHGSLHVVDGISMFITDPLDMQAQHIDVLILSSQKGLALPPGLSMVLLTPRALERVHPSACYYLDFTTHLRDGERGQTPFTPAVSIFMQLHARLQQLHTTGLQPVWQQAQAVARHFRQGVAHLPLAFYSTHMPNAMTALEVTNGRSAAQVVQRLETHHRVFRVSHMGHTLLADMDRLLSALHSVFGENA